MGTLNHKCVRNLSKLVLLTDFRYISNSGLRVLLTTNESEICQHLSFRQISDAFNYAFKVTFNHNFKKPENRCGLEGRVVKQTLKGQNHLERVVDQTLKGQKVAEQSLTVKVG